MLKECDTIYLEEHEIPRQYLLYTYDALQCFPEKTVKVFKYDLDWLKDKIKQIAGSG